MPNFKFRDISVSNKNIPLFKPLNFSLAAGDVVVIMGPSGCGKSSLLNFIAGVLEKPLLGSGDILMDDERLNEKPVEHRKMGLLYQEDLLFPHMTVGQNILYGMKSSSDKKSRLEKLENVLEKASLQNFKQRYPDTLSGGQKARVSLLRTLVSEPRLMLLDEPFSKLDIQLRNDFKNYVFAELKLMQVPCLLVTHDPSDVPNGALVMNLEII